MVKNEYRICSRTVMDASDPDIVFDENGVCNYVKIYESTIDQMKPQPGVREPLLEAIIRRIKESGKGREYDCAIGLSGGVDSSYVALVVKQLGLRPLAIHLDNGWNSELAVHNIENIVKRLNLDLVTYVIDWEEFKDLQLAYMRASVVDIEALTDNAIVVAIDRISRTHGIKYFISGTNAETEFVMPPSWFFDVKYDSLNIKAIHRKYGRIKKLRTYPMFSFFEYLRYRYFNKNATTIPILNYMDYKKKEVIPIIEKELGWRNYGGKHAESKFTEFYQNYILPRKFNVDKRRAFLSTLILSGQMSREEALAELEKPLYTSRQEKDSVEYVTKKFRISEQEFENIMKKAPVPHFDFPSYQKYHLLLKRRIKLLLGSR
jgi:N-acetyl sugar amidotransferase